MRFRSCKTVILLAVVLLASFLGVFPVHPQINNTLNIGLFKLGFPNIFQIVPHDEMVEIFDSSANSAVYSGRASHIMVTLVSGKMRIFVNHKSLATSTHPLIFSPVGKSPRYAWIGPNRRNCRPYRGSLKVCINGSGLQAINVLPCEEYLRGVVPSEIGHKAPHAAFEAQAIAARTYAYRQKTRHAAEGFDLCDSTH
ncbi:hypothetical protein HYY75_12465, partial [bacterium]|nr:hypothetical protein [bacterium]